MWPHYFKKAKKTKKANFYTDYNREKHQNRQFHFTTIHGTKTNMTTAHNLRKNG